MKKLLCSLLLLGLMAGCAAKETDKTPKEPKKAAVEQKEIKAEAKTDKEAKKPKPSIVASFADDAEEMAKLPPGELAKDFSVGHETSMWTLKEVPSDVRPAFMEKMEAFLKDERTPEEIHEAIVYYLGSAHYGTLIEPLLAYEPNFDEPLLPEPYEMSGEEKKEAPPANAVILLDASSSMLLKADGRLKMNTAKAAVRSFGKAMGQQSAVSLYAYGHKGSQEDKDMELSCKGIEEVYRLGEYNQDSFNQAVDSVEAKGWTPLAGAIAKANENFANVQDDITLYIVSDGEETCGGDPVEEAKKFAEAYPDRHVNVIGFQVDSKAESQLQAVAESGNGTYMGADSLEEMTEEISKLWLPTDMDLVSLYFAGPGGWPHTMARDKVHHYRESIFDAIRVEDQRLSGAAELLATKELINEDIAEKVTKLVNGTKERYLKIIEQAANEKLDFIDSEVDRINTNISDYQQRMAELKKKQ